MLISTGEKGGGGDDAYIHIYMYTLSKVNWIALRKNRARLTVVYVVE